MKGSITVFATMLLMLVSQFLFTVLEAGRNLELKNVAKMNSEAVAESVFAQYCRPLWDEYRILTYDAGSDSAGNVDIQNIKAYMKNVSSTSITIRIIPILFTIHLPVMLFLDVFKRFKPEIPKYSLSETVFIFISFNGFFSFQQKILPSDALKINAVFHSIYSRIPRLSLYTADWTARPLSSFLFF